MSELVGSEKISECFHAPSASGPEAVVAIFSEGTRAAAKVAMSSSLHEQDLVSLSGLYAVQVQERL